MQRMKSTRDCSLMRVKLEIEEEFCNVVRTMLS